MKKIIISLLAACTIFAGAAAQQVKVTGNVLTLTEAKKDTKKAAAVDTGYKWSQDGKQYAIYRGPKGGYYYTTPDGKKHYLPAAAKKEMQQLEKSGK